jgi:hypothetical protein
MLQFARLKEPDDDLLEVSGLKYAQLAISWNPGMPHVVSRYVDDGAAFQE